MPDGNDGDDLGLGRACERWESAGDFGALKRWLTTTLTPEGCPLTVPLEQWHPMLERLALARERRPDWPKGEWMRVEGWIWRLLHLTRPDGSTLFSPPGKNAARTAALRGLARVANDRAIAGVIQGWFPPAKSAKPAKVSTPPSANRGEPGRVLACLRTGWGKDASWLAVDARARSRDDRVELAGDGTTWIGGDWPSTPRARAPQPSCWFTSTYADCLEWTFKLGQTRVTRTAVMLRYKGIALLAQQEDGPATETGLMLPLPGGVSATKTEGQRSATLVSGRHKARVVPLNLPALPYETDKGAFPIGADSLQLTCNLDGRRRWMPALVTWGKPPTHWRVLTVTENMEKCSPEVAFGARLAWGPGEDGLLIYRSLAKPALRAVLGYQTRARFLIGRFTPLGKIVPLLTLD